LVRKIKPEKIEELGNMLIAVWSLIPQPTIDKLCEGFERRLGLCLANGEESIPNQLWHLMERHAIKDFFEVTQVYVPWTEAEKSQVIQDWLIIGPQWKLLEKKWMTGSAIQLKNRWYDELGHGLHETGTDIEMLTKVLAHRRNALPIPVLTKA
jgi:hypothetical protein